LSLLLHLCLENCEVATLRMSWKHLDRHGLRSFTFQTSYNPWHPHMLNWHNRKKTSHDTMIGTST
jgi:hypothetical protein